jgi:hypothetical protein
MKTEQKRQKNNGEKHLFTFSTPRPPILKFQPQQRDIFYLYWLEAVNKNQKIETIPAWGKTIKQYPFFGVSTAYLTDSYPKTRFMRQTLLKIIASNPNTGIIIGSYNL